MGNGVQMAKLNQKKMYSLKWMFLWYIPICAVVSLMGSYVIGAVSNELQEWYEEEVFDIYQEGYEKEYYLVQDSDGSLHYETHYKPSMEKGELKHLIVYGIISYAQSIIIPLWVFFCVALTGTVFYKRELEKPLKVLSEASGKIANNCLDFEMPKVKNNELGDLCESFEQMRKALYDNNKKTWRMLEDRKQLNAAFAHDIRTPVTILKGYTELLQKYEGMEHFTSERKEEIFELMKQQAERLEKYAQKMSTVQKLEDIEIYTKTVLTRSISGKCNEMCRFMTAEQKENNGRKIEICVEENFVREEICIDEDLVLEVLENLLTNALRYANQYITIALLCDENYLSISVEDDGKGFLEEELLNVTKPFYRANKEKEENHFGLGLYICSILCQKNGGKLQIENGKNGGGKVTAVFSIK